METIVWPEHTTISFKRFNDFYCNQALCDVNLIAQDGTTFKAHQLLLAINSSFFHWVFHGWRETNERVIEFKTDIESHVLDALLSLIYQGEVKVPTAWPWRQKILEAANTLQFTDILQALQHVPVSEDRRTQCQFDQRIGGTGFQIQSVNRTSRTETESQQAGESNQIHQSNRQICLQTETSERERGIPTGYSGSETGLQSESNNGRSEMKSSCQDVHIPQTTRSTVVQSATQSQACSRNVDFLGDQQQTYQSICSLSSPVGSGLFGNGQTNLQTHNIQSSGADVHFVTQVGSSSTASVIQARTHHQEFYTTGLHHSETANVYNTENCTVSDNRWNVGNLKNLTPVGSVAALNTAPDTQLQNIVSDAQFDPVTVGNLKNLTPVGNVAAPNTQSQNIVSDLQFDPAHLQSPKGGLPNSNDEQIQSVISVKDSRVAEPRDVGLSKGEFPKDTKPEKTEHYLNKSDMETSVVSEEVRQEPVHLASVSVPTSVQQTEMKDSKQLTISSEVDLSKVNEDKPTKGSKILSQEAGGSDDSKPLRQRQTRSHTVAQAEAASQTVQPRINTRNSEQRCRENTKSSFKVAAMKSRKHKTGGCNSKKPVSSTKNLKEQKSKAKNGRTNVKKASRNVNHNLDKVGSSRIKQRKKGQKAQVILPKDRLKLHIRRLSKTISHRYWMLLWLKSLNRANRLHTSSKHHYRCFICRKEFKRYSQWRHHSFVEHLQSKRAKKSVQTLKLKKLTHEMKKSSACLKCTECGSFYSLRKTLKFHLMQVHHMTVEQVAMNSELLVKCELNTCHFASIDFGELERHAKTEHPNVKYKCPHCKRPRTFHLLAMLDKHISKVHGDKPRFTCSDCGQHFIRHVFLQEHQIDRHGAHHSIKLFRCEVEGCDYRTVRKVFLDKHRRLGHREHKCPHCNIVVKTHDTLQTHIRTMHLNIRPFLCDICGMGFAKEPVLRLHVKTKHEQEKEFKCQYCPYGTNVHWYLANHIFHRHGVKADFDNRKEISCPHCSVKYLTNSYLQKHIRNVHDKTFKCTCDVCGKSYKSYSAMSTHRKVHQDVEQKCPYCDYSSKTGEHMKLHVRTQHMFKGMKPYGCPYCTYCSAMGGNVRKHVMHKHPGEEVKYNTNKEQIMYMQITEAELEKSGRGRSEKSKT